jgi:hypothetical protein
MKKKSAKKLSLNRETLKRLSGEELLEAEGGVSNPCQSRSWCLVCPVSHDTQCDRCL